MKISTSIHAILLCLLFFLNAGAEAQNAPPTLLSLSSHSGSRGATIKLLIDGTNLDRASRIFFNSSGLSGEVVGNRRLPNQPSQPQDGRVVTRAPIEDGATRNRLTVSISIDQTVRPDVYGFRVLTPLGVTNMLPFAVLAFPGVHETQTNDTQAQAQPIELPTGISGEISRVGDADYYRFKVHPGKELVFEIVASPLGSQLNSVLALLDPSGRTVAENDDFQGQDSLLIYTPKKEGTYTIRVSDALLGSGSAHHYVLNAGRFSYLTSFFPLGVKAGENTALKVNGGNLDFDLVTVSKDKPEWRKTALVTVPESLNGLQVAVGKHPEYLEKEPNDNSLLAQPITKPATINGRIFLGSGEDADQDFFQFSAVEGQRLILEVEAQHLGSPLDSVIEVLDRDGNAVPRAALRCVAETKITLNDPNSIRPGMRVVSWDDLAIDDYVMVGSEILQVESLPRGPDDDIRFKNFLGRRLTFLDTTAEAHAMGDPVYKIEILPPATTFPPNGMPVFHLGYRNDDGGPFHGRDSRVEFIAPQDGSYLVHIKDVRGLEGKDFAYRLNIRDVDPDFVLATTAVRFGRSRADGQTFNVPPGGQVPITVLAHRIDGFSGEITVSIEDLPQGVSAIEGTIAAADDSTVVVLAAEESASFEPFPLKVAGRASIGGHTQLRYLDGANKLQLVALSLAAEFEVSLDKQRVEIVPGQEVQLTVRIDRREGFRARVPVDIRNLPHGVRVLDVGLNGILITEDESVRTFTLYAEPWTDPSQGTFYAVGRVETNSFIALEHVSDPVDLVVLPQLSGAY